MFRFLYVTYHFQNTLGSLVMVSQFHFCLVSSLNCDSLYISLAVADLTLWPPPKTHITRNPPICWHLSCDISHIREPETHHSAQAGLLKADRHSAGNTLLAAGRAEWGVSNPALERQQRCLPTNVCKHSPFAHQKKMEDRHLCPRWNIQSIAIRSAQRFSGSVVCIYFSTPRD